MATEDVITRIAKPVETIACRKCNQHLDVSTNEMFSIITCPNCQTKQSVPARLSHFVLFEIMGKGGMAAVYRAFDTTLSRNVAIKVMRRELSEDPKFIEDFLREARSAAQLNHKNIVQIYAVGQEGDQPYIVMELLDGGRLDDMIARQSPLSETVVLEAGIGVTEGLKSANEIGLIHGDIKPANILFDRAGNAKVADFGLARFQSKQKISQGEIWGTPYYIAPEKVRGQKEDHRSDIYSLGATLYHALGGKPPFEGETATDVVLARLKQPAKKLDLLRPGLHPATIALIERMLEMEPFRRYPNYGSLLADLQATLDQIKTGPPTQTVRATPVSAPAKKGRKALVAGIVLALVAAAVAAVVIVNKKKGQGDIPAPPEPPVATTNAPTSATNAPAAILAVQPFSAEEQAKIAQAGKALAEGRAKDAEKIWVDMVKGMPSDHGGRPWLALFLSMPPWSEGNLIESERRVSKLLGAVFEAQADGSPHPGVMPQALARVVVGQAFRVPPARPGESWPEWYGVLAEFFQCGVRLRDGQLDPAIGGLDKYLSWKADEPAWVRAFQPQAQEWRRIANDWKVFKRGIGDRIKQGEGDAVLKEIDKLAKARPLKLMGTDVEREYTKTQKAIEDFKKTKQADQKKADEAAKKEAAAKEAEKEKNQAGELRNKVAPLVQKNHPGKAIETVRQAENQFKTEAGRKAVATLREALEKAQRVKELLYRGTKEVPYRAARRDLGGDAVAASVEGVVVMVGGGAGTTIRAWENIRPAVVLDMEAFYANAVKATDTERAELFVGLAVQASFSPASLAAAQAFGERAVQLNPALKERLAEWLPGVSVP